MPIFNRRATKCGHCDALIPDDIRLTKEQKMSFDRQLKQEQKNSKEARYPHKVSSSGWI